MPIENSEKSISSYLTDYRNSGNEMIYLFCKKMLALTSKVLGSQFKS